MKMPARIYTSPEDQIDAGKTGMWFNSTDENTIGYSRKMNEYIDRDVIVEAMLEMINLLLYNPKLVDSGKNINNVLNEILDKCINCNEE